MNKNKLKIIIRTGMWLAAFSAGEPKGLNPRAWIHQQVTM